MKKYNLSEIMRKANSLNKNYKLSKSESLRKSWQFAKLEILENELFELNMKDISGGANNIIAQNEIRIHNAKIDSVQNKIADLKAQIFPTVTITEEIKLGQMEKTRIIKKMNDIRIFTPNLVDEFAELKAKLDKGVETYTREKLDVNAYNVPNGNVAR